MVLNEGYCFPVQQPSGGGADETEIVVFTNAGATLTCNKSYEEITSAIKSEKNIVCKYGNWQTSIIHCDNPDPEYGSPIQFVFMFVEPNEDDTAIAVLTVVELTSENEGSATGYDANLIRD